MLGSGSASTAIRALSGIYGRVAEKSVNTVFRTLKGIIEILFIVYMGFILFVIIICP